MVQVGALQDVVENAVLDNTVEGIAYAVAAGDRWLALYTVAPDEAGAGGTEASYGGATPYARVKIAGAGAVTTWTTETDGTGRRKKNDDEIVWPQNQSGGNVTIEAVAIVTTATPGTGTILMRDASVSFEVINGEAPRIPVNQSTWKLD